MRHVWPLIAGLLGCESAPPLGHVEQATLDDRTADMKFGQPDFTSHAVPTTTDYYTAQAPVGVAADPLLRKVASPLVWVVDRDPNRAFALQVGTLSPTGLVGQPGWNTSMANAGSAAINAQGFSSPSAIAIGGALTASGTSGLLAVADTGNHRVLIGSGSFSPPWTASWVLGQHDSYTTGVRNDGGVSAESLAEPAGVAFDGDPMAPEKQPRVYVADTGNHRVLIYNLAATSAAFVIGQKGFASGEPNRGGAIGADTLNAPSGIATWNGPDPLRGFYVCDTGNHRVLHFKSIVTKADLVYGQGDDFTSGVPSKGGVSARSLRSPTAVAVDLEGGIYVADTGHHRVLHFPKGKTEADRVYGQSDFSSSGAPIDVTGARMRAPAGVAVTGDGDLIVADTGDARVLKFSKGCADGCDDGNPCTTDICNPTSGCTHLVDNYPPICGGYRCDDLAMTCLHSCGSSADCAPPLQCKAGTCVGSCTSPVQCASGHCTDGFCCDSACDGPCETCSAIGWEGHCKPVAGAPPAGRSCPITVDGECGTRCDGVEGKKCTLARKGSTCGVEACIDGEQRTRGICDGAGACVSDVTSCAPYACGSGGCRSACAFDYECVGNARCVAGACRPTYGAEAGGGGCSLARSRDIAGGDLGARAFILVFAGSMMRARRRRARERATRPAMRLFLLLSLPLIAPAFASVFGCDSSDALPYVASYDPGSREPVASTEFCSLLARNTCASLRPCCEGSIFAFDETKCRLNARLLCEARRQKSQELGLLYDDLQAGRCVRGTAILMRNCKIVNDDPVVADVVEACRQVLHGTRIFGGPCEGKSPLECAPPDLGWRVHCSSGVCASVARANGGEVCIPGLTDCAPGLLCDPATNPRRCTALLHPLGSPCDACSVGPCANDLRCGPDRFCDPKAEAAGGHAVCANLPGLGQPCEARGCSRPYKCDTDKSGNQVCAEGKSVGGTCNDDADCGSRLCIGSGIKLCGPAAMGDPIGSEGLARSEPQNYLTRIAAACEGVIPDGAGGLAPLLPFPASAD